VNAFDQSIVDSAISHWRSSKPFRICMGPHFGINSNLQASCYTNL